MVESTESLEKSENGKVSEVLNNQNKVAKEKPSKREGAEMRLLKQIYTLDTRHLIAKVGFILNQFPETRNNDKLLTVEIYKTFYSDYLVDGDKIRVDDLLILPKSYEMQRYRAHIQNVLGLFKASPDVQKKRKVRRKEWRDEKTHILSPPLEVFTVGSSGDSPHLVVGSLWIYDRLSNHSILKEFKDFKDANTKTLHLRFSKIGVRNEAVAREFFNLILKFSDIIGFEAHIFDNFKDKVDNIHEAFLQHILETIDTKIENKSVQLPKSLSIIKNEDTAADMENNLESVHKDMNRLLMNKYKNQIFIDQLFTLKTTSSPLLQIADFFAGSLLQVYGRKYLTKKPKDTFAQEVLEKIGINIETCEPQEGNKKVSITIV